MQRLKEAAEKAKIELSGVTSSNINLPYITADATGPKHLDVTLTRAKFNELTAHLVDATMEPVRQAMSDAGLTANDISKVLLVGGSTRIPAVQEAVKKMTGKEGFKGINPDECVAVGAAIQGGVLGGDVKGLLLLDVTLTRAKFNELTAHLVDATMEPVRQAMSDAGLTAGDISKVLLVGGSTRIPAVQEAVKKMTGKEGFKGINPDECVAVGAAIQAGVLGGEVKDVLLLDVTPLSLGLETEGHIFTKLIERNTTIPTSKSQVFSTAADGQTAVEIHVLQGERPMAYDNKTLGRFQLTGIPAAPRGVPQIEVTFSIDRNGIVNVSAKDKGTGNEQKITITASTNMTEEEINQRVKEAEQYAEQDKKRKEEVEVQNRADTLIYEMEKQLRENGDKLDSADKETVQHEIDEFKKVREGGDTEAIKNAMESMTQKVYQIFGKIYQQEGGQPGAGAGPQVNEDGTIDADAEVK